VEQGVAPEQSDRRPLEARSCFRRSQFRTKRLLLGL